MYSILIYIMMVISLLIIVVILLQPSKQQDALSLLTGDNSSALFATQRPRGLSYLLQYMTGLLGITWLILGLVIMYFSK